MKMAGTNAESVLYEASGPAGSALMVRPRAGLQVVYALSRLTLLWVERDRLRR